MTITNMPKTYTKEKIILAQTILAILIRGCKLGAEKCMCHKKSKKEKKGPEEDGRAPCAIARLDVPVGGVSDASRRDAGRSAAGPGGPRRATRVGRITELVRRSELFRL